MTKGDDEKRKLSWREIDKLKDKSGFSKIRRKMENSEGYYKKVNNKTKERYLKELEKLFEGKKDAEKEVLLASLHKSYGTKNFKKLAKEFFEKFGLPEDLRSLFLFLDLDEREIVLLTLEKIKESFPSKSIFEKQSILSKLKTLSFTTKDEKVGAAVEKLLKEMSL